MAPDSSVNPPTPQKEELLLSKQPILRQKQLEAYGLLCSKTKANRLRDEHGNSNVDNVSMWNLLSDKARNNPKLMISIVRGHQGFDPHYKLDIDVATINHRVDMCMKLAEIKFGDERNTSLLSIVGRHHEYISGPCVYDKGSIWHLVTSGSYMKFSDSHGHDVSIELGFRANDLDLELKKKCLESWSNCCTIAKWFWRCKNRRVHTRNAFAQNHRVRSLQERFTLAIQNIASIRPHRWVNSLDQTQLAMANRLRPNGECLGIELEFLADTGSSITNWDDGEFPVYPWLYYKGDGSIRTSDSSQQLAHFQELTWFINGSSQSDWKNMEQVLKKMTTSGAIVNNSCGNHVHLDMRNRSQQSAMRTATKVRDAINTWAHRAVSFNRSHNHYCGIDREHSGNRYTAVNTQCYSEHQTIEVRLGMPTLNYYKLKYWCRFMQYLAAPYNSVATLEDFMQSDAPVDLKHYVFKRILKFQTTYTSKGIPALPNFDSYAIAMNQLEGGVE